MSDTARYLNWMFQTSAQHFEAGPAFAQRLFVCRIAFGRRALTYVGGSANHRQSPRHGSLHPLTGATFLNQALLRAVFYPDDCSPKAQTSSIVRCSPSEDAGHVGSGTQFVWLEGCSGSIRDAENITGENV